MTHALTRLFFMTLMMFAIVSPHRAEAIGGGGFDNDIYPVGVTDFACEWNIYHDPAFDEAEVRLNGTTVGGNFWLNSNPQPDGDITAGSIQTNCPSLSNVTNLVTDGANGTYGSDDFMGASFRADFGGTTYDFVIGMSGASNTTVVNTRTVAIVNTPPTSEAGPNQTVASGATVTLAGSGTDADSDPITYAWTQLSGTTVPLSSSSIAGPTFTAPTLAIGAADAILVFRLVTNDATVDSAPDTVTITVTAPPNTPATAVAGLDATVASGATVNLTAAGSAANDSGQSLSYTWTQTSGTGVTLTGDTTATPSFTAPTLIAGAADTALTFSLVVNDGVANSAADTVTITVEAPANTPATADAGPDATVASGAAVTLDGSGSNANDTGQALTFNWFEGPGSPVTLAGKTTSAPTFTAPTLVPGASDVVLTFFLQVNDGVANSASDSVTITVEAPANVVPTADAGTDAVYASGATVTLNGSASDANNAGQSLTYAWTQTGGAPTVSLTGGTTAAPSFFAPPMVAGAPNLTLTFSLTVNDGLVNSVADTVVITITAPPNTAPTADAGAAASVASGASVNLNGAGSDANDVGQALTYAWTQTGGTPTVSLTGGTTATPSFTAPTLIAGAPAEVLTFSLIVNDGVVNSVADTVQVTVNSPLNTTPTADAGAAASALSGTTVTLDGSGSDANDVGQSLTYIWSQTGGAHSVSLTGATTAAPSFTAPTLIAGAADVPLTFTLLVNDGVINSVADTVVITITSPPNTAPTANAGSDATVASGATVNPSSAGSSANDVGQSLTYAWTQSSGPTVVISNGTTAAPSFTAPTLVAGAASEDVVLSLTVNDGVVDSVADTVTYTVTSPPNTLPTAHAGSAATVASGATVNLDGSASDANDVGQTLTYAWSQTAGPLVTLTGGTTVAPSFTAPTLIAAGPSGLLTFSLIVNDGVVASVASTVDITVTSPADTPATANAGSIQTVSQGTLVTLDGSGSDANDVGQSLSYIWRQISGTAVILTGGTSVAPTFTAPAMTIGDPDQTLTFGLIVTDLGGSSTEATVDITVTVDPNTLATANAGPDQSVNTNATVTLDGSGSDANDPGQVLSFAWTQTAGTTVALTGGTTAAPTFIAPALAIGDADEVLTFSLVVNDGFTPSVASTVDITVSADPNTPATADAGAAQSVATNAAVTLDGSASDANDAGQTLTYMWTQTAGTTVALTGDTTAAPTFTAPAMTIGDDDVVLTFSLVVNDGIADSTAATVDITVSAEPNTPATADAGAAQSVTSEETVTLDGSASDANDAGQTLTYAWTETSGAVAAMTGPTPSFTAPTLAIGDDDVVLTFSLVVNDGIAESTAATVEITVAAEPNTPATADAGSAQTVASEATVTLDGSASDANDAGQTLTYAWTETSGAVAAMTGVSPSFTAPKLAAGDANVVLTFSLVVNDGIADSAAATVVVTVEAPDDPPVIVGPTDVELETLIGENSVSFDVTVLGSVTGGTNPVIVYKVDETVLTGVYEFPVGETTVTIDATDDLGLVAEQVSFKVTVLDLIAPAPAAEINIAVNVDGSVTVSGTAENGSTVRVTFPDGSVFTQVVGALTQTRVAQSKSVGVGTFSITSASKQPAGIARVVVVDPAGNASEEAQQQIVAAASVAEIQENITGFLQARASHVVRAQPDLIGHLSGTRTGKFNANVTRGEGTFEIATSGGHPVWAQLEGGWSTTGGFENSYFMGAVGAHYAINPNALVGVMVEFDQMTQENGDASTKGTGYLAGPYFVAKLPDQPLFIEGRYLIGKTTNTVIVTGTTGEEFETDRTLASVKVAGQLNYGKTTLTPSLTATHMRDSQNAFVDSFGRTIAAQGVEVNDVALGLDFSTPVPTANGELTIMGGLSGIWSQTVSTGAAADVIPATDGGHARVHLGAQWALENNVTLTATGYYDGIGSDDYESYGVSIGLTMSF